MMNDVIACFVQRCRDLRYELSAAGIRLELKRKKHTEEIFDAYDDNISFDGAEGITAILSFDGFEFLITYNKSPVFGLLPGTMYISFRFDLDPYGSRILSYDMMPQLSEGEKDFGCVMFSYISCEEKLLAAFEVFKAYFERYRQKISDIAFDGERRDRVLFDVRQDIVSFSGTDIFESDNGYLIYDLVMQNYRSWQILRYMNGAYSCFLRGKLKKAARSYKKAKARSAYEDTVLNFITQDPEAEHYDPYLEYNRAAGESLRDLSETGEKFVSHFELAAFFFGYLVGIPLFTIPYVALYMLFAFIAGNGALFYSAFEPYNVAFAAIPAIFTAIPFSFYVRKLAYKLFFKKKYQKIVQTEALTVTDGTRKFMKVMLNIILIVSIVLTVLISNCGIAVTENGVVDKSGFFDLKGRFYEWDSIDSVWLIDGRFNDLDEWLDNPSYVLLFKDGTKLDLYQYTEYEDVKEKALATLSAHCGEPLNCRSIDEVKLTGSSK